MGPPQVNYNSIWESEIEGKNLKNWKRPSKRSNLV